MIKEYFEGWSLPEWPVLLIIVMVSFIVSDCTMGVSGEAVGAVNDRRREVHTTCDDDGCSTRIDLIVTVDVPEVGDVDVSVTGGVYRAVQMGETVNVKYRRGNMSGYWYLRRIERNKS